MVGHCTTKETKEKSNAGQLTDKLHRANHFGFFFRKALEGVTTFGFLTDFAGFFTVASAFAATFFFGRGGLTNGFFTGGFTGSLGSPFLLGGVCDTFCGVVFATPTDFIGFFAGLFALDVTGGDFTGCFAGFAAGFVTGTDLGGSFGVCGLLVGSALTSPTGVADADADADADTDAVADCAEKEEAAKTGEIQLRLTASRSIALNCDSNSGESGTS